MQLRRLGVGLVLLCVALTFSSAARAQETKEDAYEKFEKQRRDYYERLRFRGAFTYCRAEFDTLKEARSEPIDEENEILSGFLAKSGDDYRLLLEYPRERRGDYVVSTGITCDKIGNKSVKAVFYPTDASRAEDSSRGVYSLADSSDPLEAFRELLDITAPVALAMPAYDSPNARGDAKLTLMTVDETRDRARARFEGRSAVKGRYVKDVVLLKISKLESVPEEIAFRFYDSKGEETSVEIVRACQWVDSKGQKIPTRLRSIRKMKENGVERWIVGEWKSADVGKKAPIREDFILNIKSGTDVPSTIHNPGEGIIDLSVASVKELNRGSIIFQNELRVSQ